MQSNSAYGHLILRVDLRRRGGGVSSGKHRDAASCYAAAAALAPQQLSVAFALGNSLYQVEAHLTLPPPWAAQAGSAR